MINFKSSEYILTYLTFFRTTTKKFYICLKVDPVSGNADLHIRNVQVMLLR